MVLVMPGEKVSAGTPMTMMGGMISPLALVQAGTVVVVTVAGLGRRMVTVEASLGSEEEGATREGFGFPERDVGRAIDTSELKVSPGKDRVLPSRGTTLALMTEVKRMGMRTRCIEVRRLLFKVDLKSCVVECICDRIHCFYIA